jgi:hypothetical protein
MARWLHWLGLATVSLLLSGCLSAPSVATPRGTRASIRNEGYSILYELLGKQRSLDTLLLVKNERVEVRRVIKEIARVSKEGHAQLTNFAKADASLDFKAVGLPLAETKTRQAIEATRTKQLLLSSGGKFELHLLLSQSEALSYGAHLARVIRELDSEPTRQAALEALAQGLERLREDVLKLLQVSPPG